MQNLEHAPCLSGNRFRIGRVLCIADPPRAEAKQAITMLREAGISNLVMLTGDSEQAASRTAEMLGITQYHAQVLPEDKHRYVEELKAEGKPVIMVGDGINDAPHLRRQMFPLQ